MRTKIIAGVLMVGALHGGCAAQREQERHDQSLLQDARAREQARMKLGTSPGYFIHALGWEYHDKGIINDYTKAVAIDFENTSPFDVSEIQGVIMYLSASGVEMAAVPFKAHGVVLAGRRTRLPVNATEISGKVARALAEVRVVRILGE